MQIRIFCQATWEQIVMALGSAHLYLYLRRRRLFLLLLARQELTSRTEVKYYCSIC